MACNTDCRNFIDSVMIGFVCSHQRYSCFPILIPHVLKLQTVFTDEDNYKKIRYILEQIQSEPLVLSRSKELY